MHYSYLLIMKLSTSLLTLIIAYLCYNLYVPLTPGYDWQMSYEGMKLILIEKSVMLADSLGFDSAKFYRHILKLKYSIGTAPNLDPDVEFENFNFGGIPVRLYKPRKLFNQTNLPGVIIFHGGGWTVGSVDAIHSESCRLSKELQAGVLAVEYRLAPEHIFPVPFMDCLVATKHFLSKAETYGVNPQRIALKGFSAGGTLVVGVSLALRNDNFHPQPKLQVVVNAPLQGLTLDTPSYQFNAKNAFQTRTAIAWFLGNYLFGSQKHYYQLLEGEHVCKSVLKSVLNELVSTEALPDDEIKTNYVSNTDVKCNNELWKEYEKFFRNEYAFPLMAKTFSGLPTAHVYTCQADVLRDDGILFARKLRLAGNNVKESNLNKCHHLWNVFHQFDQHTEKMYDNLIQQIAKEI